MDWERLLSKTRVESIGATPSSAADFRSEFQRDHDRVVFLTSFRRLQDKAQVWPLERNDGVRTRLTHTLEVSRIASGLATAIAKDIDIDPSLKPELVEVTTTAALMHDLGNPPFGHSGEYSISSLI